MPPETDQRPVRGNSPEAVKGWLDGQGYAVEHRVATHLARRRWVARQGLTYRDPTTAKTREVDVAARALLEGAIELHLVVECKRSAKAWVTRTTSSAVLQKGRVTWKPVASSLVHELLEAQPNILRSLPINRQVPFDVVEAWHERRDENQNPAHNALSQVVSGAVGLLSNADQFPNPALMHPVVVLEGSLFRASFADDGTSSVEQIQWERVHWSGASNLAAPVVVDVVTLGSLDDYLTNLQSELEDLNDEFRRVLLRAL